MAVLSLLAAGCSTDSPPPAEDVRAQNLLLICIDTLRADHVGAYGYERDTTPVIDGLARTGVLFEDVIAHSPWTVPSVASLLTSLYPSQHGAGLTGEVRNWDKDELRTLRKDVVSLAQVLRRAGFRTAVFSGNPLLRGPLVRGFEQIRSKVAHDATSLTDLTIEWLAQSGDMRFFAYLQYMDAHMPVDPPQPFFNFFEVDVGGERGRRHSHFDFGRLESPEDEEFQRYRAHRIAVYDGALRFMDQEIGRLLDYLESTGQLSRTLVVVTSDHGEEFWDHAEVGRRLGGDPRGLWGIGHGHTMFQELLRVPLIVHGPGVTPGKRIDCPSQQLDVAPTALALLGLDTPAQMQGRDLESLLRTEGAECRPQLQVAESPAYGLDAQSVTWRGIKLIRRSDGVRLLYDLSRDPGEEIDLAGERPDLVARLEAAIEKELGSADGRPGERAEVDSELERELRTLGYID